MHPSMIQTVKLQRILVTNLLVLAVVVIASKAVSTGSAILMAAVLVLPISIYFINRPVHLLITSFLVGAAGVTLPGIPGGFSLETLLHGFVAAIGLGYLAVDKDRNKHKERSDRYLITFALIMLMTMAIRGAGIRLLGSDLWGGRTYITAMVTMAFYILSPWMRFRPLHVKVLVVGRLLAGLLPAFVQGAFLLSGGTFYILAYFVDAQLGRVAEAAFGDAGSMSRFSTLRTLGASLLPFAFVFPLRRWKAVVIPMIIIPSSLLLTALSGFRSLLLGQLVICFTWGLITFHKKNRLKFVAAIALVGLIGWFALIAGIGRVFPLSVQRAVSFVPLANVDEMAQDDADRSTMWRLEIWALAWEEIPQYMIIGKGFSFPAEYLTEMVGYGQMPENRDIAFLTHNYHSGPLLLLLDLGVPGFLLCTAFFFVSCREHASALKRFSQPRLDHLYYKFMTIVYIWQVASFYLIYGDLSGVFVRILVNGAMLRILRYSLDEQLADEEHRREQDAAHGHAAQAPKAVPQVRAATWIGA